MDEIGKRPVTESALDKARQAIEEGLRQISESQKLIKIADRLQYGWGVVVKYLAVHTCVYVCVYVCVCVCVACTDFVVGI